MPISPTAISTTADSIYHIMRERIVSAEWMPGERLVHRHLAKHFGASNSPVLEALRRLESEGLVTSYPNAGAQVKVWTEDDIRGTFLAREALEGVTCRLFAENASPREKAKLVDLGKNFDDACKAKEFDAGREADIAFHLYVAGNYNTAAQSSTLFRLVKNSCLLAATIRSICMEKPVKKTIAGPVGVHDSLIEALNSNNPEHAENTGKAHVRESMEGVLELFAKRGSSQR